MFDQADCAYAPPDVGSDADIAGEGVLLSFSITSFIALFLSAMLILEEFYTSRNNQSCKPSTIRRKLLNGYSDQQIMTGIGIQAIGLAHANTMVPYHFFLIWMLSLLTVATHNATLLALVHDFRRDRILRWLRQALMGVNLLLSCTYGVFILQSKIKGLPDTMPIACAWTGGTFIDAATGAKLTASPDVGSAYAATILTIAGNCVIFVLAAWYLHSRAQRFFHIIRIVGLVLMICSSVGAAIRAFLLSQAFGTPNIALRDQGEKAWGFEQLLLLLLLILPLVSAVEMYRGEIAVPPPVEDKPEEKPLAEDPEMQSVPEAEAEAAAPAPAPA